MLPGFPERPPNGEGLARYAILARSKCGEIVRTSRARRLLGGVFGVVNECPRAKTGVPEKSLSVRSRLIVLDYEGKARLPYSDMWRFAISAMHFCSGKICLPCHKSCTLGF